MENSYVVYLDVVFLINFLMDLAILWATSKLGHFKTTRKKLLLSALLGSTYTLALFIPELNWLFAYGVKFLFSLAMVALAYVFDSWKRFVAAVCYFYMVAFMAAGAMLGMMYFFDNTPLGYAVMNGILIGIGSIKFSWLIAGFVALLLVGRWGAGYLRKNLLIKKMHVPVVIRFGANSIPVKALVDTGNHLKDPLTQHPVMIVEYGVMKEVLPEAIQNLYASGDEPDYAKLTDCLTDRWWNKRLRLIPFSSIGKRGGMMLAFRPDLVFIQLEENLVEAKDVVVAVCNKTLSSQGTYRALLHLDMLQETLKT